MDRINYYEVLGVNRGDTPESIRKAYLARARAVHPDLNGDSPESIIAMQVLNEAYSVLGDAVKKRDYDKNGPMKVDSTDTARVSTGDKNLDLFLYDISSSKLNIVDLLKKLRLITPVLYENPIAYSAVLNRMIQLKNICKREYSRIELTLQQFNIKVDKFPKSQLEEFRLELEKLKTKLRKVSNDLRLIDDFLQWLEAV